MNQLMQTYSHGIGTNIHKLEWVTKYRYKMFRKPEFKKLCEDKIHNVAGRHNIKIRKLSVMPEHIHTTVELPMDMSPSKALQILKGGSSYEIFRAEPKFRFRYPNGSLWCSGKCSNTIGYSTIEVAENYVRNQEYHHNVQRQRTLCSF